MNRGRKVAYKTREGYYKEGYILTRRSRMDMFYIETELGRIIPVHYSKIVFIDAEYDTTVEDLNNNEQTYDKLVNDVTVEISNKLEKAGIVGMSKMLNLSE